MWYIYPFSVEVCFERKKKRFSRALSYKIVNPMKEEEQTVDILFKEGRSFFLFFSLKDYSQSKLLDIIRSGQKSMDLSLIRS